MRDCRTFGFILLLAGLLAFGCGGGGDDKTGKTKAPEEMTEEEKVMASMTELIERLIEGDKTVLYEHEFSYFKDETPLSDYLEIPRVADYAYDTLSSIGYDSVVISGDSARVYAVVTYESKAGGEIQRQYSFWMYNLDGTWKKPYRSSAEKEREYIEEKRRYEEEAEKDAAQQSDEE